jgi:cytochrome b6
VRQPSDTGWKQWLAERYPIGSFLDWARAKSVPVHRHSVWYSFGGMLLFLLGLQIVTGVLLAFYYHPTEEAAYKSVVAICGAMPFGWVLRSLHAWTANVMVAVAFVHLFSVWLLRSFRKPRELTWVTGVLVFGLLLGFGFSGYLLPWDELAFFATKVGTKIVGSIPVVGYRLMTFLRGGEDVSGDTISRFFAFHVCALPLIVCAIAALHVLLVQIQGVSVPPSVEAEQKDRPQMPFFPDFLLHDLRAWLILFGALVTLAVALPWPLGNQANPLAPAPAGIRPEWYFLSMYQVLKLLPTRILGIEGEIVGAVVFLAAGLVLLFLPFVFKQVQRAFSACTILAVAALIFLAAFTVIGYVSSEREKSRSQVAVQSSPAHEKADAVAKSLAAAQVKIRQERSWFLLYVLGLWGGIAFLVVVIYLRLAHTRRVRQAGLGG